MSVPYSLVALGVSSALEPFSIDVGQRVHSPLLLARVARSCRRTKKETDTCLTGSYAAI